MQRHKLPTHGHGYTAYKDVIPDDSGVGGGGMERCRCRVIVAEDNQ